MSTLREGSDVRSLIESERNSRVSPSKKMRTLTKLRSSDLALAQITAKWRGALTTFQVFQEGCEKDGFDRTATNGLRHRRQTKWYSKRPAHPDHAENSCRAGARGAQ